MTDYKYPWGNIEPNERYIVIDPITKGGWFASEWEAQPPEVRALGMVSGYWAVREADEAVLLAVRARIESETAGMSAEELAAHDQRVNEELMAIIAEDNEASFGPKTKRKGRRLPFSA